MKTCPLCRKQLRGVIRDSWECPTYVKNLLFTGTHSHYRLNEDEDVIIHIDQYRIIQSNEYSALLDKPSDFHIYKIVEVTYEDRHQYQYQESRFGLVVSIPPFEIKSEAELLSRLKTITNFS